MSATTTSPREEIRPPVTDVGMLGWLKHHLFNGFFNSIATLVILGLLLKFVPQFIQWAFIDSVWFSSGEECHAASGACWSVVTQNIRFNIFGYYPVRTPVATAGSDDHPGVHAHLQPRLEQVEQKTGLSLAGCPLRHGIADEGGALRPGIGREHQMERPAAHPAALLFWNPRLISTGGGACAWSSIDTADHKIICVVYIEMIRGVPLITMLFMSSVMFPLFLPEGVTVDKVLRAQAAIILFTAAYIAEVVRGGLQAMDKGQYEAAESLGPELLPDDASHHTAPGAENRHSTNRWNPDLGLQGHIPCRHHRPLRHSQHHQINFIRT